jgi:hypothetical protein
VDAVVVAFAMRTNVFVPLALATSWACGPTPASTTTTTPAATPVAAAKARTPDCGPEVRAQAPELVGRIACHAALRPDADVILGLEITTDNQPVIDAYFASDADEAAVDALLAAPHFASETKDGRSSQAMIELLTTVPLWRSAGAAIEVVCFDAGPGVAHSAADRDAAMAKTLGAIHRERPGSTLVVLSGNVHNRTVPGVPWDAAFVPMGAHLREAFPKLVSLDFRSAGGTFWACMGTPGGGSTCGLTQGGGEDRGVEPFVELFAARDDKGFDGVLYVGTMTASEPAVPAKG